MKLPLSFSCLLTCFVLFSACKQSESLFEEMESSVTNVDFVNKPFEKDTFNILYYLYYYNGAGVATGDINNDGFIDIYFTSNNKGGNKLYLNKGKTEKGFSFEDITEKAGVAGSSDWCTGVTMVDVDGNGLLDIYVSAINGIRGLKGKNELFMNQGNGNFKESATELGLDNSSFATQSAFFDYDRDGDLDCYLLSHSQRPHQNIADTSARRIYSKDAGDRLMRNDLATTGKFTDVSALAGIFQSSQGYGLGIATSDINQDGWDDIYVGNDFHENDYYYINNQNGTFTESGAKHFKHYSRFSMGNDVADYNNDGQVDLITVDMLPPDERVLKTYGSDENLDIYKVKIENNGYQDQYSRNVLQMNNGQGRSFSDVGILNQVSATDWSWAPLFADFDNDGVKDLFVSSGIVKRPVDLDYVKFISSLYVKHQADNTDLYDQEAIDNMPDGASHPFFFKGDLNKGFSDVSKLWGTQKMKGYYTGAAYADFDNDGDLDVVINQIGQKASLLKNNSKSGNYLQISLEGNQQNKFGLGAKVYLFTNGSMQYQELMLTRGFQSAVSPRLHFGLGTNQQVDSLLVVWPSQQKQMMYHVNGGHHLVMKEANASGTFVYQDYFPIAKPSFTQGASLLSKPWKHQEDGFLDFNKQHLIPHLQSTRGPKLAVADINKDGLDDFFVCGGKGQGGSLQMQTATGKFTSIDDSLFAKHKNSENIDALFFDANGDGFQDLYVANGGNEFEDGDPLLADQLFINNGKGHFVEGSHLLPSTLVNKTTVVHADIDKDGDQDLFIGASADAMHYGISQKSYLLINDGKGKFSHAQSPVFEQLGMVHAAAFGDMDKDGWMDLVVAGEFSSMQILFNKKGNFQKTTLPKSTGLWQCIKLFDVNGDGNLDILAGNWGLNNKLVVGKTGPVKMFVKDFDKNGSLEQVVTYQMNGKDYTFLAKDELERSLPVLKKAYLTYKEVAGKTVDFMFYDLFKDYQELQAEILASSCFMNQGKGNFEIVALPSPLQIAPIFDFAEMPTFSKSFLAIGNFYGVIPYEGKYDGLEPTIFQFNAQSKQFSVKEKLIANWAQYRDAKWIKQPNGRWQLILASNNQALQFFGEPKNSK